MATDVKTDTAPKADAMVVPLVGESLGDSLTEFVVSGVQDDLLEEIDWSIDLEPEVADTVPVPPVPAFTKRSAPPTYPAKPVVGSAPPDVSPHAPSIADDPVIRRAIQSEVATLLAAMGIQGVSTPVNMQTAPVIQPPKYLKHYRNDKSPTVSYQELDMRALDRDERPQQYPIAGSYIRFRNGHFYAMTQNQVRQMEWMMQNDAYAGDGLSVIGGDPSIYEDDEAALYHCNRGCDWPGTPSKNAYHAHMRSVHGITMN